MVSSSSSGPPASSSSSSSHTQPTYPLKSHSYQQQQQQPQHPYSQYSPQSSALSSHADRSRPQQTSRGFASSPSSSAHQSPVMMKQSAHYPPSPSPLHPQHQQGHPNAPLTQSRPHKQQQQQPPHMGDHEHLHTPHARSHSVTVGSGGSREVHAGSGHHHSQNPHDPTNGLHRTHNRDHSQSGNSLEHHHKRHGTLSHPDLGSDTNIGGYRPSSSRSSSSVTPSGVTQATRHPQPQQLSHSSSPRSTFSAPPPPPVNGTHGGVGPIRSHNSHHPHPYHPPASSSQSQSSHSRTHSHSHSHQLPPQPHSHRHTSSSSNPYPHPSQRHGYSYDLTSSGALPPTAGGADSRFPHPDQPYNPHSRHSSHKSESYLQTPAPSGRRPSQSSRPQGSTATGGPHQQPTSSQLSMAMDEDEDDDEDDGEIKQETRGRRRSNSLTSGLAQDGGANKKQAQDGDHAETHKCTECGKVYKHPNCLWKHRWLHSQYWKSATKFLLSKHQQVQLMEAAAILLGMDESRQGDNDPIVSMFSKQRGALANSVGSGSSSSSASPPTYTKSLSGSPPPQSERQQQQQRSIATGGTRMAATEVQHADIQMLTALRGGHASLKAISTSFPTPTPPVPVASTASVSDSSTTKATVTSASSSQSSSPSNLRSGVILPSTTSSSSRSTPPTLTADDESVPEMDEEMTIVTPPSRGESTPIIPVVRVLEKLSAGAGVSVGVVGMGIGMDVDPPKRQQQGSQIQGLSKQGQISSHKHQHHDYRAEDRYRYSGFHHQQQQQQQPLPFHHQSHLQGPAHPYGGSGSGSDLGHPHQAEPQQQHSRPHQHQQQSQQYRS